MSGKIKPCRGVTTRSEFYDEEYVHCPGCTSQAHWGEAEEKLQSALTLATERIAELELEFTMAIGVLTETQRDLTSMRTLAGELNALLVGVWPHIKEMKGLHRKRFEAALTKAKKLRVGDYK